MAIKVKSLKNLSKKQIIIADNYIRQAGIMTHLGVSCVFCVSPGFYNYWKKFVNLKYHFYFFCAKKETVVFYDKSVTKRLADFGWQKYSKNKKWLDKVYQDWEKGFEGMKVLGKEIYQKDLTSLSNKALRAYLKRIIGYSQINWGIGFLTEAYDEFWEDILKDVFTKEKVKTPSPGDLATLLTSIEPPFLTIAEQELIKIKKQRNLTQKSKLIEKFVNKYYYLNVDYSQAEIINESDVKTELKKINIKKTKILIKKQRQAKKQRIFKKCKFTKKAKRAVKFFSQLSHWRDQRKEFFQITAASAWKIIKELHQRYHLPARFFHSFSLFDWREEKTRSQLLKIALTRGKRPALFIDYQGNVVYINNQEFKRKLKNKLEKIYVGDKKLGQKILSGQIAQKGKIQGRARIILSKNDFKKFKPGNVLVTSMTRPDFLPLIKKARAIVTDEGGITSHAAIISRELKKPCLMGAKIATRVLRDGDLVEVDANKGVVKILKNEKK